MSNPAEVTAQVLTEGLMPGDAVSLWWVIFNEPEKCTAHPEPCTLKDLFNNRAEVGGEVIYGAGQMIGESGKVAYGARLAQGARFNGWFGHGLANPTKAEIQLLLYSHGQVIPETINEMLPTSNGDCQDSDWLERELPVTLPNDNSPKLDLCKALQIAVFQQ